MTWSEIIGVATAILAFAANSRMDQLLKARGDASRAKGMQAERDAKASGEIK